MLRAVGIHFLLVNINKPKTSAPPTNQPITPAPTNLPTPNPTLAQTPEPSNQLTPNPTLPPLEPNQTPYPSIQSNVLYFTCGDGNGVIDFDSPPPSTEVEFDYELHNSIEVTVGDALEDVKQSILSDLAEKLGCTETTRRQLQGSSGNIVGIKSGRSDLPDPNAVGCLVEVKTGSPSSCTPVGGGFTIYVEAGTSDDSMTSTSDYLKATIKDGMDSGSYESTLVEKVTYIGDRDLYLKGLNPPPAVIKTSDPPPSNNNLKYALYALAGAVAVLLCLLCMLIPSARRKKRLDHDEEDAMHEFMETARQNRQMNNISHRQMAMSAPQLAIQRRTEELRAIQIKNKRPPPPPRKHQDYNTASESDHDEEEEEMYGTRGNRRRTAAPVRPRPPPPVQSVWQRGEFYTEDEQSTEQYGLATAPDPNEEAYTAYPPGPSSRVESLFDDNDQQHDNSDEESGSSEEYDFDEQKPPAAPIQRRNSSNSRGTRGSVRSKGTLDSKSRSNTNPSQRKLKAARSKRDVSKSAPVGIAPQLVNDVAAPPGTMSKEERQRRIESARSKRGVRQFD